MRQQPHIALLLLCAGLGYGAPPKDVPSWVTEAGSKNLPAYSGKVPAAVLLEEQRSSLEALGLVTTRVRKAVKILTHDGQREADAVIPYFRGGSRVKALHAWLVAPNGFVKTYDKNSIADMGSFDSMELYNDARFVRIRAENPEVGAVFAYEAEIEEKALFAEDQYAFQSNLPALESRYALTVPSGWSVKGTLLNHAPVEPQVDGSTYSWKLSDLPFREREGHGPEISGIVPRLAISFFPDSSSPTCFRSWKDVSRWHTVLSAGQDEVTPEIAAKSREVTASAKTEYAKIQAIGQYVQKIKYVAIEMDLPHGGGYKPHAADLVLRKQYGDCKDKANLMRALLKAAGIESYLVGIYSGDRTYVRDEWPSPSQFNHMIIAVKVANDLTLPTVTQLPALGRVLIFDPTSETTPIGDLPWYEQGSFAAVMAGEKGDILKMPSTAPDANITDVTVNAELAGSGQLTATCALLLHGQAADQARARKLYQDAEAFRRHVLAYFSQRASGLTLSKLDTSDQFNENNFRLNLAIDAPSYGQLMQNRLLVFNPSILQPDRPVFTVSGSRTEPIILRAESYRKHIHIKLPSGFTVDELPTAVKQKSEWGEFSLSFEQKAGELVVEEDWKTEAVTLPPAQYKEVKQFFDQFGGADQQQAVLVKN